MDTDISVEVWSVFVKIMKEAGNLTFKNQLARPTNSNQTETLRNTYC